MSFIHDITRDEETCVQDFSSNLKEDASELREILEDMFLWYIKDGVLSIIKYVSHKYL